MEKTEKELLDEDLNLKYNWQNSACQTNTCLLETLQINRENILRLKCICSFTRLRKRGENSKFLTLWRIIVKLWQKVILCELTTAYKK